MAKGFIHFKIDERSMNQLFMDLKRFNTVTKTGAKKVLRESAINIMNQSQLEVPVDTGTLKSTKYIEQPKQEGDRISIKFGYGGAMDKRNPKHGRMASSYAIDVHETKEYHHAIGKWKFLEDPTNAYLSKFYDALEREVETVISMWRTW